MDIQVMNFLIISQFMVLFTPTLPLLQSQDTEENTIKFP
ncbi:hypothetical protein LEP1GSC029_3105 [Leptospira interrogans str. 2002000626]|uniref:Uncharacterized protein n=1 Tax=Leptospira interrogans str. 2002000626 TaxID=996803 RepID=A0A829D2T3_LEPIR|nr:hypothetical protein LEP1GSC029_3105 [Leptospira interrogans str. 2002000626]